MVCFSLDGSEKVFPGGGGGVGTGNNDEASFYGAG